MALTKISTAMWDSVPHHDTQDFNVDDAFYVDVSAGNVGIGTASPSNTTHIYKNATIGAITSTTTANAGLRIQDSNSNMYLDGNSIVTDNTGFLTTTGNNHFEFGTNNTARIHITGQGNVGIGTDSPSALLHVRAANNVTGTIEVQGGKEAVTSSGEINSELNFGSNDPSATGGIGGSIKSVTETSNGAYVGMSFYTARQGRTPVLEEAMRIKNDGNVGIGTASPNRQLHIIGQFAIDDSTSPSGGLLVSPDSTSNKVYSRTGNATNTPHPLDFISGASTSMRITSGGNVGIGTTSPSQKLSVRDDSTSAYPITLENTNIGTVGVHTGIRFGYINNTYQKGAIIFEGVDTSGRGKMLFAMEGTTTSANANETDAKMVIDYSGNVGIGTSPGHKLHVAGATYIEHQGTNWNEITPGTNRGSLHIDPVGNGADNTGGAITFGASDAGAGATAMAGIYTRSDGSYGTKMYFATTNSYSAGSKTSMFIGADGKIGIGITSPAGKLHVSGDIRGTIFYDTDNTGYYGDFAGNSRYNTAQGNYLGLGVAANTSGGYRLNMNGSIDMNNYSIDYVTQLHFHDNVRFYDEGNDNYLNFKYGDANAGGIKFRNGSNSLKGYLYADNSGFGLLDNDGAWALRTQTGTSPLELRCDNNIEFEVYNSYTNSPGSSRAPIFYDSDNTAYYVNPAGNSKLGFATFDGYDGATGDNTRSTVGVSVGRYTSEYSYIELASSNASNLSWIDFSKANGTDYHHRIRGYNAYLTFFSGNNEQFRIYPTYTLAMGSSRAPIFYDTDNTNWYVNPASTSQTDPSGKFAQYVQIGDSTTYNTNTGGWGARLNVTDNVHARIDVGQDANSMLSSWYAHTGNTGPIFGSMTAHPMRMMYNNSEVGFWDDSKLQHNSSVRAPIFYDTNNTDYYCDPASTSRLYKITLNTNQDRVKLGVWNSTSTYGIGMANGFTFGALNDYAMTFEMNNDSNRGFWWGDDTHTNAQGAMALTTDGRLTVARSLRVGYGESDTTSLSAGMQVSGDINVTGDVVAYSSSDERLKDNKKNIENALKKVESLNGVEFDWNDKQDVYEGHDIGIIAQEVEKIVPEIVNTRDNGYKAVKYEKLVPLLIEAIKELSDKVKALENK